MVQARDGRILFLMKALAALIFISKISLGSVLPIPHSVSIFIFQQGLASLLMNVFLCFVWNPTGLVVASGASTPSPQRVL